MWPQHLRQDLRYALRQWRRSPGFVLTAVLTLALGIGGTTAMFTLMDTVLLRELPVVRPGELYRVGDNPYAGVTSGLQNNFGIFSWDLYQYFRENTPEFQELAAFQASPRTIGVQQSGSREPAQAAIGEFVSGNYFSLFGVAAFAGRVLNNADDELGARPVAVLNYHAWRSQYSGSHAIIGSTLDMNHVVVTVVGVAPPDFFGDSLRATPVDFWVSLPTERAMNPSSSLLQQPQMLWLDVMGRVRPDTNPQLIESRMNVELRQWLTQRASSMSSANRAAIARQELHLVSGRGGVVSARSLHSLYAKGLRLLMMISGFVLLIVCANIANLVLVRELERGRQTSISVALGAQRGRLMARALTENVLLALAGGACGLFVAYAGTKAILTLAFAGTADAALNPRPSLVVLLFVAGISILTGALFGIVPAWASAKANPIEAIRGAGRATSTFGRRQQQTLVIIQAALSLALLSASGLLLGSLRNLADQDLGFQTAGRIAVRLDPYLAGYKPDQLEGWSKHVREQALRIPGVADASLAIYGPLSGSQWQGTVYIEGQRPPDPNSTENDCPFDKVGPGYFQTVGTRIVAGRDVLELDTATSRRVAIVNESFARRFFGRENPLGRHFGKDGLKHTADYEIVGIIEDAKYFNPEDPAPPMFFLPLTQAVPYDDDPAENTLEIRTLYPQELDLHVIPGARLSEAEIRRTLGTVDPILPVVRVATICELVDRTLSQQALIARLTLLFGLTALAMVALGTYGVTAWSVQQRTREIGVRMALGATRASVLALMSREAFRLLSAGVAFGLPLALAAGRLLGTRLYGVSSYNLAALANAILALAISAAIAVLLPATRAASVQPIVALRHE